MILGKAEMNVWLGGYTYGHDGQVREQLRAESV